MYNNTIDNLQELTVNPKRILLSHSHRRKSNRLCMRNILFVDRYNHFPTYNQGIQVTIVESTRSYLQTGNERELPAGLIDDPQTSKGEVRW